jgi:hypothetical protein
MKKDIVIVSIPIESHYKFNRRKFAKYICPDATEFETKAEYKRALQCCYDYPNEQGGYSNEDFKKFIELGILEKVEEEIKISEDYNIDDCLDSFFWKKSI